jgi:hypothetical protein
MVMGKLKWLLQNKELKLIIHIFFLKIQKLVIWIVFYVS